MKNKIKRILGKIILAIIVLLRCIVACAVASPIVVFTGLFLTEMASKGQPHWAALGGVLVVLSLIALTLSFYWMFKKKSK
ncbi:hypothetical protein LCGC14_0478580 [marine sediment metagenome]|uniref:Uncharacterized protein n=1 Tax=marine sediment metagenome TaxID=412755 RepID=A0A0F9SFB4_9ZZZZ